MRTVTVRDILKLPIMHTARIVAGKKGLDKPIHYVTVFDNLPGESDKDILIFDNDIYLTSLYYGLNNDQFIIDWVKYFAEIKASCVCVIDEYIHELPDEAIRYCDEQHLPIIFISRETPYSLIIQQIMEFRLEIEKMKNIESSLNALTKSSVSLTEKREILKELNPYLSSWVTALFCFDRGLAASVPRIPSHNEINLLTRLNQNITSFAAEYRGGFLVLLTCKDAGSRYVLEATESVIEVIRRFIPDAVIGISESATLNSAGDCILQAFTAAHSGDYDQQGVCAYRNLGITRLLIALEDRPEMDSFYHDILDPILDYDARTKSQLFDTMAVFIENAMDYKKTSEALFLHENSIRYRINKIRELIPYGKNEIDFLETISVVYKIYKLKKLSSMI